MKLRARKKSKKIIFCAFYYHFIIAFQLKLFIIIKNLLYLNSSLSYFSSSPSGSKSLSDSFSLASSSKNLLFILLVSFFFFFALVYLDFYNTTSFLIFLIGFYTSSISITSSLSEEIYSLDMSESSEKLESFSNFIFFLLFLRALSFIYKFFKFCFLFYIFLLLIFKIYFQILTNRLFFESYIFFFQFLKFLIFFFLLI